MMGQEGRPSDTRIIVPGEGPPNARIMLVGQNPGKEEVRQGRPFVGRSGKYLDEVLKKHNIDRRKLYITSIVKETTPKNRPPTAAEIKRWMPRLLQEISEIKPATVLLMGRTARQTPRLDGIRYIETCHPSAAMRFPKLRKEFEKVFKDLRQEVDRPSC
ncbi:MAG: uracil-DNA glycosylase [Chloroflexi bacterium]|nr:uracil-DNA glycosylase [Chloroflexota bacterium]